MGCQASYDGCTLKYVRRTLVRGVYVSNDVSGLWSSDGTAVEGVGATWPVRVHASRTLGVFRNTLGVLLRISIEMRAKNFKNA